jgi:hypothetical protein
MASSSTEKIALKQFIAANGIVEEDAIFTYDAQEQKKEQEGRPWKDDIHYFKKASISLLQLGQNQCNRLDKNGYPRSNRRIFRDF